jgi:hypothetical protein
MDGAEVIGVNEISAAVAVFGLQLAVEVTQKVRADQGVPKTIVVDQ